MKAVHFGAGNIGRGFVGLLLHDAGYEVVFADVNAELIDALAASESYQVHEVGDGGSERTVTGFRAVNSATHEAELIAEIQTADVVTTAVGPNILRFVAPVIAKGLALRDPGLAPLAVMACENADQRLRPAQDRGSVERRSRTVGRDRGTSRLREHRRRPDRPRPGCVCGD